MLFKTFRLIETRVTYDEEGIWLSQMPSSSFPVCDSWEITYKDLAASACLRSAYKSINGHSNHQDGTFNHF
jgi:hypothetical protein